MKKQYPRSNKNLSLLLFSLSAIILLGLFVSAQTTITDTKTESPIGNFTSNFSINENLFFANADLDRVGIGTTTPSDLLEINGSATIGDALSGLPQLTIKGGSVGGDIIRLVRTSGANLTYGWNLAGGRMSFHDVTNGGDPFSIGLVGGVPDISIGLDNPASSSESAISGVIRGANAGQSGTDISGANLTIQTGKGEGAGVLPDIILKTADLGPSGSTQQSVTTKAIIKGNGNVGIGTTNPDQKLTINGSLNFGDDSQKAYFGLADDGSITFDGNDFVFNVETAGDFVFSNGKVGINNTNPTSSLQVGGNISIMNQHGLILNSSSAGVFTKWNGSCQITYINNIERDLLCV